MENEGGGGLGFREDDDLVKVSWKMMKVEEEGWRRFRFFFE